MNVTHLTCYAVRFPLESDGYTMSHGRHLTELQSTVVQLETQDGTVGYGEVCTLGGNYIEAFPQGVRAAIQQLGPVLVGRPMLGPDTLERAMDLTLSGQMAAKAAIDGAMWDLRGKLLDQPVAALLGGVHVDSYPVFYPIGLGSPAQMAQEAAVVQSEGYRCWQLKLGDEPSEDAERLRAVLGVVGDTADFVTSDANGGWSMAQTCQFLSAVSGLGTYVEQPCQTIAQLADIRRRSSLPIIVDEALRDFHDLVACIEMSAADAVNIKPARVGGLTRAARLRDAAQRLGLMVMVDDPMGGEIATAAVSHLAASCRPENLLAASYLSAFSKKSLAVSGAVFNRGRGCISSKPGLGVEVDQAMLGEPLFSVES